MTASMIGFSVTTAHHLDIGALYAGKLRHRRRGRHLCRGSAVQGDQGHRPGQAQRGGLAHAARQHPRLRPRRRRHGSADRRGADRRRALSRAGAPLRPRHRRRRGRRSHGLFRATDARGNRRGAGRHLSRRDHPSTAISTMPIRRAATCRSRSTITVAGDEMTVDLTGTAPQVSDKPINMPLEGTVDCAVWLTIRSILLDSVVYGHIPQNSGLTRPIRIVAPKGTPGEPDLPRPGDRALLPRQPARRHGDEGAGAGGAAAGQRRHRQSARHRLQRPR